MFQDGIVAQGVIDVVNAGKTYASSAANNWGTDGYASVFRPVANGSRTTPATNAALAGTNINLSPLTFFGLTSNTDMLTAFSAMWSWLFVLDPVSRQ